MFNFLCRSDQEEEARSHLASSTTAVEIRRYQKSSSLQARLPVRRAHTWRAVRRRLRSVVTRSPRACRQGCPLEIHRYQKSTELLIRKLAHHQGCSFLAPAWMEQSCQVARKSKCLAPLVVSFADESVGTSLIERLGSLLLFCHSALVMLN